MTAPLSSFFLFSLPPRRRIRLGSLWVIRFFSPSFLRLSDRPIRFFESRASRRDAAAAATPRTFSLLPGIRSRYAPLAMIKEELTWPPGDGRVAKPIYYVLNF